MCEQDDLDEFARRSGELTRRQFGAMALGAGLVAALPKLANADETKGADVDIKTPDGIADAYFVHPAKRQSSRVCSFGPIFSDCARPSRKWPLDSPSLAIRSWSSIPFIARRKHQRHRITPISTILRPGKPS